MDGCVVFALTLSTPPSPDTILSHVPFGEASETHPSFLQCFQSLLQVHRQQLAALFRLMVLLTKPAFALDRRSFRWQRDLLFRG